ncbi:MAG: response regulator transcription factor [Actinobacteria bacterium]|nr:response regulator transcription factor [Actinomycetota bacterium]
MERRRILVVEDDADLRTALARSLERESFVVDQAGDGPEALTILDERPPDLVVLDIELPTSSGLDVLARLRRTSDVPVIFVTGRSDELDRVLGLELGADDYIVKPFYAREVAARIKTVLRRQGSARGLRVSPGTERLEFDGLAIDFGTREIVRGGTVVDSTAKEFDLLAFLAGSPRQVFSREQLLDRIWASSAEWQDPATVTEHVRRLRAKIESDPARPRWVRTVRGVGYRFEPQ